MRVDNIETKKKTTTTTNMRKCIKNIEKFVP